MSDDRGRWRGGSDGRGPGSRSRSRRSRSRGRWLGSSTSRSRSRSRSRGRDRRRSRSRSRGRSRDGRRRRGSSRSRSGGRRRYRSRSHERRRGRSDKRDRSSQRWSHDMFPATLRLQGYADALSAGMDDDLDGEGKEAQQYTYEAERPPTDVLKIWNLPEDATEAELRQLFQPVGGLKAIMVPRRSRDAPQIGKGAEGGHAFGYAHLKFESAEAAAALMASEWRLQTFFGQHRLHFQYAYRRRRPPPASPARSGDGGHSQDSHPPVDWVCEYCGRVNFGRRSRPECYQCQRRRSSGAQLLYGSGDEPSCILRVSGLQPSTDEEALRFLFVPHAPVQAIRLLPSRYPGEHRGGAYIQFYSVEDAVKAMAACKDARLDTQEQPLHICFSTARFAPDPAALQQQGWLAPEAAAEMALASAGWQPKEFGGGGGGTTASTAAAAEGALDDDPLAAWERQQAEGEEAAEEGQIVGAAAEQAQQQAQQDPAAALEQQRVAAEAAGFAYDPGTGYMLEPTSGYYYDANTGLYCHPSVGHWGTYDFSTSQFVPHDAAAAAAATALAAAPGFSSAAEGALAMGSAHAYSARLQQGNGSGGLPSWQQQHEQQQQQQQQQQEQQGQQASKQRPKRGAVIGASAQLDHHGLLAAAWAAEEKVQLLKKEEAKQAAEAKRQEAKAKRQALDTVAATAAAAAAAAAAPVQGVIHQSSWAANRR